MAPSIQGVFSADELDKVAQFKLAHAFDNKQHSEYEYKHYLPVYDETTTFDPIQPFDFIDRGSKADKAKPYLLDTKDPNVQVTKLTPRIGTEIRGLQLSQLTDTQKDELALLIAERGVVVFREQDFKDIGVTKQKEFGQYFGPLHIHVRKLLHNPHTNSTDKLQKASRRSCQGSPRISQHLSRSR